MKTDWETLAFGDVLLQPTRNGIHKGIEFQGHGTPVIKMGEVYQNREINPIKRDLLDLTKSEIEKLSVQEGDLLFCRTSLVAEGVGHCAIVKKLNEITTFASNLIRARIDKSKALPNFYRYYFSSPQGVDQLLSIARGTSVTTITGPDISSLIVPYPPLSEQRAIAGMLGALDDKIELNHHMNRTMESIAWAMFHRWFVESDESKNWEEKSLDEIADFLNGLALQKFPAEGDEYLPVIKIAQLRKNDTKDADKAGTNIPPEYIIEDGDVLFSWSGSLDVVIWCGGKGALNQHLFKVTSEKFPKWFYYFWTKHHLPEFQGIAAGKATTMGHIQRHHLTEAKVLVPSDKELQEMDKMMSPFLEKIIGNEKESHKLADLRNTLLQELIRGDVRVKAE